MTIALLFAVAEGFTLGLTFIWFAGGALLAMIVSFFNLGIGFQVFAFILGSGIMLIYTRPIAVKVFKVGGTKTNVDSLIGKEGKVVKTMDPFKMGQVNVKGQIWSAKPENDETITEDTIVEVVEIAGVKLIVRVVK
jgi:membrane protein implicated in regulation of membrane protease activity